MKFIAAFICVIGISAVFYGMLYENNAVFIPGIVFLVCGYIMIRKRLKESATRDD